MGKRIARSYLFPHGSCITIPNKKKKLLVLLGFNQEKDVGGRFDNQTS
jgi:hypothetical protein